MKELNNIWANKSGVHPDCLAINSTGAATPDGSEFIAEYINNVIGGPMQAFMAWAAGGTNTSLSGTPGVPDGVIEAAGASQILEAMQKGNAVGPGMPVVRFIEDSPAVYGDRVIQLAGQGVLVATYPDLTTACWIGGNDAAQVAAKAAGEKFWRADDAIGTTPLAAGPYLMLPDENPTYLKQYSEAAGDFTTSGPAGWSHIYSYFIPYQLSDGSWRLTFNLAGSITSAAAAIVSVTGLVFKNSDRQGITNFTDTGGVVTSNSGVHENTGNIAIETSASVGVIYASGDVALESKPTWADDFSYDWYITY